MRDNIRNLLNLAITAPSGDNCQPWRFLIKGSTVELFNDPDADASFYNHLQRASLVSHGALIENIAIAAPAQGLKPSFELSPNLENTNQVASISFEQIEPVEAGLADYIQARTTNRRKYSGPLLNEEQLAELNVDQTDLQLVSTFLTNNRNEIDKLSRVVSLSDQLVFEFRPLHDFLFEHIRWSDEEATRLRDGLDIKTLELSAFDRLGFNLLKSWSFASFANKLGASRAVAANARKLMTSASAVGLILGQGEPTPQMYLDGGRLLQRIWLQATKLGFSFHPMMGICFLIQRVVENAVPEISLTHCNLLRRTTQTLATLVNIENPVPIAIFRIGSAPHPSARSLRKEISSLLCE